MKDSIKKWLHQNGALIAHAWPGGYPVMYLNEQGNTVCPDCANKLLHDAFESYKPMTGFLIMEGPNVNCEECKGAFKTAYGDPAEVEEDKAEKLVKAQMGKAREEAVFRVFERAGSKESRTRAFKDIFEQSSTLGLKNCWLCGRMKSSVEEVKGRYHVVEICLLCRDLFF